MTVSLDRTRSQDIDLAVLLSGIDRGSIALPEFQRDFVWSGDDVRALLATVLTGWPMGSVLLMEGGSEVFGIRPFDSAPPLAGSPQYVVLDGQQRLTSLYHALYSRGALRYGLQLELLRNTSIEELEQAIMVKKRAAWDRQFPDAQSEARAGVIPTTALRSAATFYEWRDTVVRSGSSLDVALESRLTEAYRERLSGLHRYDVPSVIVDRTVEPAAIARIFERVNRTGISLGTFDLAVARSFTQHFNLRERWEVECEKRPEMASFLRRDGLPVLTAIALRTHLDLRQSAVLALRGDEIRDYWARAVDGIDRAVSVLSGRFGVKDVFALPNQFMLPVLAALDLEDTSLVDGREVAEWFWWTGFTGAYEVASNTRAVSDYQRLRSDRWRSPESILLVRERMLSATRKTDAALHRTFVCMIAAQMPLSLTSGEPLGPQWDEVSLFDRSSEAIETSSGEAPMRLRTLSVVLKSPGDRADRVRDSLTTADAVWLRSQLLPSADTGSGEEILGRRLLLVREELEQRTGLKVRVLSESESDVEQQGRERFRLLIDVLAAQGQADIAEAIEYVDWLPDRLQLVVSASNRSAAGRLIGSQGKHIRQLIGELPLLGIHVEVVEIA